MLLKPSAVHMTMVLPSPNPAALALFMSSKEKGVRRLIASRHAVSNIVNRRTIFEQTHLFLVSFKRYLPFIVFFLSTLWHEKIFGDLTKIN